MGLGAERKGVDEIDSFTCSAGDTSERAETAAFPEMSGKNVRFSVLRAVQLRGVGSKACAQKRLDRGQCDTECCTAPSAPPLSSTPFWKMTRRFGPMP